ncbi:hypothetical protein HMI49_37305 [Corallococcus exercitus]|uniref:Uncharacterized protein n=1 Tax=Corallococcus exercitus TaxID=2316736 RepID=A0A7Y4KS26_9BACT|nr:hypothetical protein [Corallococcus exercitus]NOK38860.1 hypothetical protein [Corallococcus exercitus]
MAEERFRVLEDLRKMGRVEEASALTRSPISFFKWLLARELAGESLDVGEPQLGEFQQGFPPAEQDFANLRRHVCIAASALLTGRPVGANPKEALSLAHRAWNGGWQDLEISVEACGAAVCARDESELALWKKRAQSNPAVDWVETFEETLFLLEPSRAALGAEALATSVARVATDALLFQTTISAAPLVCALWQATQSHAPIGTLLSGRAQAVDAIVFGPEGEKPRLKIGKPSHDIVETDPGPLLVLGLKVTGNGPLSPGGYSLAPFTYQLAELVDRIQAKWSRLAEPERTQKLSALNAALARKAHAVTFRIQLARGVELSPEDEEGFRARITSSWEHARRSLRDVQAEARVEFVR